MHANWSPEADFSMLGEQVRNSGNFLLKFADSRTKEEASMLVRRFQECRMKKDYQGCLAAWRELEKILERNADVLLRELR